MAAMKEKLLAEFEKEKADIQARLLRKIVVPGRFVAQQGTSAGGLPVTDCRLAYPSFLFAPRSAS